MASRTRTGPRNVPLVLPRSFTRTPSLTARSSQWNALTSVSSSTMPGAGVPPDDERVDVDGEGRAVGRLGDAAGDEPVQDSRTRLAHRRLTASSRLNEPPSCARPRAAGSANTCSGSRIASCSREMPTPRSLKKRSFSASCARTCAMKRIGSPVRV